MSAASRVGRTFTFSYDLHVEGFPKHVSHYLVLEEVKGNGPQAGGAFVLCLETGRVLTNVVFIPDDSQLDGELTGWQRT